MVVAQAKPASKHTIATRKCYQYNTIQYKYTEITNLAGSEVEGVWANIQCDKQHLALGVMYRTPSSNNAYIQSMLDQIDNIFFL